MTKEVNYSGGVTDLTETEANNIVAAAQGWHDPANGQVVNHVNVTFDDDDAGVYQIQTAVRLEDVDNDAVQTAIDNLAIAVSGLPNFGTVGQVKDDITVS